MDNETRRPVGPVLLSVVTKMVDSGILPPETLVKRENGTKWIRYETVMNSNLSPEGVESVSGPSPDGSRNATGTDHTPKSTVHNTDDGKVRVIRPDTSSPQVRAVLKEHSEARQVEVLCLECGYKGPMPVTRDTVPVFFTVLVVVFPILLFLKTYSLTQSFIALVIMILIRRAFIKHFCLCPACKKEIGPLG